jgi:hypothetical protein
MQLHDRRLLPLVTLSLVLAMSPVQAASRTSPAPRRPFPVPSSINGTNSQCSLGQTGSVGAYQWFYPSNDYYYTFFDPTACGCAVAKSYVAHWALFWATPCQFHVQVWVVPAVNAGGCFVPSVGAVPPDPTTALCNSSIVLLDGSAGGLIDHAVSLPAACNCLDGPFFVVFKIIDSPGCPVDPGSGSLTSPGLVYDSTPDHCISYNSYPGSVGTEDLVVKWGFAGNTTMWVDADCCVTPTLPGTWGKIKTLYR